MTGFARRAIRNCGLGLGVIVFGMPGLQVDGAMANSTARPEIRSQRLTPTQIQQLSRDLTRPNTLDFFQQGQRKLEREIEGLQQRQRFLTGDLLKVRPDLQIQRDLSPLETPIDAPNQLHPPSDTPKQ